MFTALLLPPRRQGPCRVQDLWEHLPLLLRAATVTIHQTRNETRNELYFTTRLYMCMWCPRIPVRLPRKSMHSAILLSCVGEITASADHVRHHNRPIHSFPSRPSLRRLHLFAQIPVMENASDSEENLYVSSCIIPFKMLELNLSPPDWALMSRMRLTTRS